jgi:hypothetical protein
MGKTFEEREEYQMVLNKFANLLEKTFTTESGSGYLLIVFRDEDSGSIVTNLTNEYAKMALEDILEAVDK